MCAMAHKIGQLPANARYLLGMCYPSSERLHCMPHKWLACNKHVVLPLRPMNVTRLCKQQQRHSVGVWIPPALSVQRLPSSTHTTDPFEGYSSFLGCLEVFWMDCRPYTRGLLIGLVLPAPFHMMNVCAICVLGDHLQFL